LIKNRLNLLILLKISRRIPKRLSRKYKLLAFLNLSLLKEKRPLLNWSLLSLFTAKNVLSKNLIKET